MDNLDEMVIHDAGPNVAVPGEPADNKQTTQAKSNSSWHSFGLDLQMIFSVRP